MIPEDKARVILRVIIEVNGNKVLNQNDNVGFADISWGKNEIGAINTPESIANYLYLYSGVDLMRQLGAQTWFVYEPIGNLSVGQALKIAGREYLPTLPADTVMPVKVGIGASTGGCDCTMTFKVIDNLPADAIDFTKEQWGHDVTIHSCSFSRPNVS